MNEIIAWQIAMTVYWQQRNLLRRSIQNLCTYVGFNLITKEAKNLCLKLYMNNFNGIYKSGSFT